MNVQREFLQNVAREERKKEKQREIRGLRFILIVGAICGFIMGYTLSHTLGGWPL